MQVHKFVCRGTLEERIDELIGRKRQLAVDLLGDASEESVLKELGQLEGEALQKIFRLDEDKAVCDPNE